jgi:hypothetical protein
MSLEPHLHPPLPGAGWGEVLRPPRAPSTSPPILSFPYKGLIGVGIGPFPLAGEGEDGGRGVTHSPPPVPSPLKGEGKCFVSL